MCPKIQFVKLMKQCSITLEARIYQHGELRQALGGEFCMWSEGKERGPVV